MDIKQFEQELKSFENTQSPGKLFKTIFDLLSKEPSWEERDVLEMWLMTYSFEDTDRVADYWKSQLYDASTIRQKKITTFLTVLAKRNMTARSTLKEFLKKVNLDSDPTWENLKTRIDELDNQ